MRHLKKEKAMSVCLSFRMNLRHFHTAKLYNLNNKNPGLLILHEFGLLLFCFHL